MKIQSLLTLLTFATVALAGCADSSGEAPPEVDPSDLDNVELEAGKGAIAGLVVDDRFRPIAGAEVLVQEAGATVISNANGEFAVLDLEPRTYTLRVNADGHEATPSRVTVEEGVFAEASLIARRVSTSDNTIVTEEYTAFVPCAFVVPGVGLFTLNCVFDLSGDTFRSSVTVDYSQSYGDNITHVVAELLVNNEGNYAFPLRDNGQGCPCYGRDNIDQGTWGKVILRNDPDTAYDETSAPWTPAQRLNIGMFYAGDVDTPAGNQGAKMGITGRFMVSLFLSEPAVDLETYALIQP